ncbi:hypothetical protein GOODEAATRI_025920 [Goodea atripinnis]|uniref:Recombination activating protein 1 n=1 Tax=Goodea atripinnis TaxID=208336 RepID=A0ABV0P7U5_9TELE
MQLNREALSSEELNKKSKKKEMFEIGPCRVYRLRNRGLGYISLHYTELLKENCNICGHNRYVELNVPDTRSANRNRIIIRLVQTMHSAAGQSRVEAELLHTLHTAV